MGAIAGALIGTLLGLLFFDRSAAVVMSIVAAGVFGLGVGMLIAGYSSLESPDPGAEPPTRPDPWRIARRLCGKNIRTFQTPQRRALTTEVTAEPEEALIPARWRFGSGIGRRRTDVREGGPCLARTREITEGHDAEGFSLLYHGQPADVMTPHQLECG